MLADMAEIKILDREEVEAQRIRESKVTLTA